MFPEWRDSPLLLGNLDGCYWLPSKEDEMKGEELKAGEKNLWENRHRYVSYKIRRKERKISDIIDLDMQIEVRE